MIKRKRFPQIFFGWWTVLTAGTLGMWGAGYTLYGFSALFKPIAAELGFSRAVTSVAASIGRLEGGIEGPVAGWLTDRFGPKWIVLFSIFLTGLGLILMNFVNSLWAFYVVWGGIVSIGFNIGLGLPMDKAIADWFVKKRGSAMGIKWGIRGLHGVIVLLIAWLIIGRGWRMTCLIGGMVMLVVGLPLSWFSFKQHRPEYYGILPDGATAEAAVDSRQMIERGVKYAAEVQEVEFTLRQAMRTPAYWLLIVASGGSSLAAQAFSTHSIPFLTDIGFEPLRAAGMVTMMVGISIPARVVGGLITDRVKKQHLRFLLVGVYLLEAVGITVFLLNQSIAMIYLWFILRGISMGVGIVLIAPIKARYFGRKAFGSITGFSTMFLTPVVMAAPIYVGWVYDTTGSYISAFTLIALVLVIAAVLAPFILPPKPPAQITDIHKIV